MQLAKISMIAVAANLGLLHLYVWLKACTSAGSSYHAVVMDFGSCQEAHIDVQNRTQALAVQEDAEAGPWLHLQ